MNPLQNHLDVDLEYSHEHSTGEYATAYESEEAYLEEENYASYAGGFGEESYFEEHSLGYLEKQLTDPHSVPGEAPVAPPPPSAIPQRYRSAVHLPAIGRPLRVCCIGPNFSVGGVRQHLLALLKFLDPKRLQVKQLYVTDERADKVKMPVSVKRLSSDELKGLDHRFDVALMWGDGFNRALEKQSLLRVFIAHGETEWTRQALLQSSRVVDHVIAVSERVRQRVCQGFSATTIWNGIDTARLAQTQSRDEVRSRYGFQPGDFVVGSLGRLTREKQFDLLIRSVHQLPAKFKLLLVGSGRRQGEVLELANRYLPGRFALAAAHEYLGDYYHAMDAFGMVSAHEGFGLVLAEAMFCGVPVFATDVGCVREVIATRINGVHVEGNEASIAKTIRAMDQYRHWTQGMAAQGRAFAQQHLQGAQMALAYESLISQLFLPRRQAGTPRQA